MTRAPTLDVIYAAELRVAQSKQATLDSLRSVRVAFRATLARPSTLALVVGAGGLLGMWLARRPQATARSDAGGGATSVSTRGLVLAFIGRYMMRRLPFILREVWAAQPKRATRVCPDMSKL